jgi:hypothetical protein
MNALKNRILAKRESIEKLASQLSQRGDQRLTTRKEEQKRRSASYANWNDH